LRWWANLFIVVLIGASWGFKSTAMLILMPALLLLNWRIRPWTLVGLSLAFAGTLVLFFLIFDSSAGEHSEFASILLTRLTVLQGDVSWHIWDLYSNEEPLPNYWPTLLAAFGDTFLSLLGPSRSDPYEWMLYHYDWMITYLAGAPLDQIEGGHSITATPFSEGILAGGITGVVFFVAAGGVLVGSTYRIIDAALRRGRDVRATIVATYFCFNIFPWLNAGAVVQLFHISLLISLGGTWVVLSVLRRPWVFGSSRGGSPAPPLAPDMPALPSAPAQAAAP
jgi:hypothetical protein